MGSCVGRALRWLARRVDPPKDVIVQTDVTSMEATVPRKNRRPWWQDEGWVDDCLDGLRPRHPPGVQANVRPPPAPPSPRYEYNLPHENLDYRWTHRRWTDSGWRYMRDHEDLPIDFVPPEGLSQEPPPWAAGVAL